ncbi:MAG TPA: type II toxin-antitoxin system PemK/MazF family toxin [Pirellulales bacterium]|jgi:mRNA-degrading endonuclease toxin of MazEF toxin-antitoxin module|nr:type II toxin-antitoxin system PemK/MazF family toxin [Pirellulales bacterium]
MTQRLATGRIVWVEIADSNGIRKQRPAVIVSPTDQLKPARPFDVVAVTTRLAEPLPEDHVLLPWHPKGHPRTRLNRRCAAVCTWLAQIVDSDIRDVAGIVPSPIMVTILAKVASAIPPTATPPDADSIASNAEPGRS